MKFNDKRSFKAVVAADYFVNPANYPSLPNTSVVYDEIRDSGYGIIKMPPTGIPKSTASAWVVMTADQIQQYSHRGFKALMLGVKGLPGSGIWLPLLKDELRSRKISVPRAKVFTASGLGRGAATEVRRFLAS